MDIVQSSGPNLRGSVKLDLDLLKPWRVSAPAAALRLSYVILGYARISQDILGYPWLTMLHQDCCMILPPRPFSLENPSDMSLEDAWQVPFAPSKRKAPQESQLDAWPR